MALLIYWIVPILTFALGFEVFFRKKGKRIVNSYVVIPSIGSVRTSGRKGGATREPLNTTINKANALLMSGGMGEFEPRHTQISQKAVPIKPSPPDITEVFHFVISMFIVVFCMMGVILNKVPLAQVLPVLTLIMGHYSGKVASVGK